MYKQEYDSDENKKKSNRRIYRFDNTRDEWSGESSDDSDDLDDADDYAGMAGIEMPQILYCSRTHTQISQFVHEIRRTEFPHTRVVSLASRRNMCINSEVQKLTSDATMSERCLEMQKCKANKSDRDEDLSSRSTEKNSYKLDVSKAASSNKRSSDEASIPHQQDTAKKRLKNNLGLEGKLGPCSFHNRNAEWNFVLNSFVRIRDIEELVSLGEEVRGCPYYSTRRAVRAAQVVCMPYNVLLQADLRSSMGIRLERSK